MYKPQFLHKLETKVGNVYDFEKNCHLTHVFPLSDGSDPQGYCVIYDRLHCKDTINYAEVVVTYNPYVESNYVIFGFGDYNGASSAEDIEDESEMIRYSSLSIDVGADVEDALKEGDFVASLLNKSFFDAYLYIIDLFKKADEENEEG